jgi:thioredoxin 1
MLKEINKDNFQSDVLESDKPVLIDFWAVWCGPCQAQTPIVEKIAEKFEGKAVIGKLDVEANNEIAAQYNVMAIPTIIVFKGGQEVERLAGLRQEAEIEEALNKHL